MVFITKSKLRKKYPFILGLMLALSLVGFGTLRASQASAACGTLNDILHCGTGTAPQFIAKVTANTDDLAHHDLKAIYAHPFTPGSGISTSADYANFSAHAVAGTAYKDGTIKVVINGKTETVLTGASSIGRLASYQDHGGSNYQKYTIGNVTYYGNPNSLAFAADHDSLPVMVLFDGQGNVKFAVLTDCGNPIFGTSHPSGASCTMLNAAPVSGQLNTYNFTASAAPTGNAVITKYVYNFGDGTSSPPMTSGSTPVKHTYTKASPPGGFVASVTAYASWPGSTNVPLTVVTKCKTVITVVLPYYECKSLSGPALDQSKMYFQFIATANYGGGAVFTSADFNFGDGNSKTGVKANTDKKTATFDYQYTVPGNYTAKAILHFTVNGQPVTSVNACPASVSPTQPPTPECKPGIPEGSPLCTPCQYNASLPANSPQCFVPPPVLPNTGAGNTVAVTGIAAVAGFLVYRQIIFRRHKKAFLAADYGTSPLPLGQPLDEQSPLSGTPLEQPVRSTLRRRRPF